MHYSLAFLLVLLTSCQPALQPFSHLGNPPNKLVKLTDDEGIMVIPVINSSGTRLDLLTYSMIKEWNLIADEAALATTASIQELIKKIDWSKDISNK